STALGRYHSQVIRGAAAGDGSKEIVPQAKVLGITPVVRNICLRILNLAAYRKLVHLPPIHSCDQRRAIMIEIAIKRIRRAWFDHAIGAGIASKIVIERV